MDRCSIYSRIAFQIQILTNKVCDTAIGDPALRLCTCICDIITAELRAALEIDPAALSKIDTCTLFSIYYRTVLCGISVSGKLRTVGNIHRHAVLEIDRTT